jgi:hypothetical protein
MNQFLITLLNRLSFKLERASEIEISKRLAVPHRTLAGWRKGSHAMEESTVRLIAEILDDNPDRLALQVAMECAKDPRSRAAYARLLEQQGNAHER